jgi:glucose-6-phosphate isomerase
MTAGPAGGSAGAAASGSAAAAAGDAAAPGPQDVAEALRHGLAPSEVLAEPAGGEAPPPKDPADDDRADGGTDDGGTDDGGPSLGERPVTAGGVTVRTTGGMVGARDAVLEDAVADGLASSLTAKDSSLWGPDATAEASIRLGWLDLPSSSRALLPRLRGLRAELAAEGLDHVVLAGMGGSSLAPEVITLTAGVELTVLDTTDPGQVRTAIADRIDRTVVVVSSKSGGTLETDSHRRVYLQAFADAGLSPDEAAKRIIVVTDPGSPFEELARTEGYREVFLADPNVGGRYSALSAFGLVPSALAGVDVEQLLDDAAALEPSLSRLAGNPALVLGAALGGGAVSGHDKLALADAGSGIVGFGDWAEQLVAESTGKEGKGLLPVVVESTTAPGFTEAADTHLVTLNPPGVDDPASASGTSVSGPLGAQFLLWEYATAVAGRALRINPFDQPNVAESKANTTAILDAADGADGSGALAGEPVLVAGDVEVYDDTGGLGDIADIADIADLTAVFDALLGAVPPEGYLAILAYLDRGADAAAAELRPLLAARLAHPVTFGWGPRFLHSTGQYHKGGPQVGAFLQITGAVTDDVAVPGRPFTLGRLQAAQALGDLRALAGRGRPAVRLHLRDRARGLAQLLDAARRTAG